MKEGDRNLYRPAETEKPMEITGFSNTGKTGTELKEGGLPVGGSIASENNRVEVTSVLTNEEENQRHLSFETRGGRGQIEACSSAGKRSGESRGIEYSGLNGGVEQKRWGGSGQDSPGAKITSIARRVIFCWTACKVGKQKLELGEQEELSGKPCLERLPSASLLP